MGAGGQGSAEFARSFSSGGEDLGLIRFVVAATHTLSREVHQQLAAIQELAEPSGIAPAGGRISGNQAYLPTFFDETTVQELSNKAACSCQHYDFFSHDRAFRIRLTASSTTFLAIGSLAKVNNRVIRGAMPFASALLRY